MHGYICFNQKALEIALPYIPSLENSLDKLIKERGFVSGVADYLPVIKVNDDDTLSALTTDTVRRFIVAPASQLEQVYEMLDSLSCCGRKVIHPETMKTIKALINDAIKNPQPSHPQYNYAMGYLGESKGVENHGVIKFYLARIDPALKLVPFKLDFDYSTLLSNKNDTKFFLDQLYRITGNNNWRSKNGALYCKVPTIKDAEAISAKTGNTIQFTIIETVDNKALLTLNTNAIPLLFNYTNKPYQYRLSRNDAACFRHLQDTLQNPNKYKTMGVSNLGTRDGLYIEKLKNYLSTKLEPVIGAHSWTYASKKQCLWACLKNNTYKSQEEQKKTMATYKTKLRELVKKSGLTIFSEPNIFNFSLAQNTFDIIIIINESNFSQIMPPGSKLTKDLHPLLTPPQTNNNTGLEESFSTSTTLR